MDSFARKEHCNIYFRLNGIIILLLNCVARANLTPEKRSPLRFENTGSAIRSFMQNYSIIPDTIKESPQHLCKIRYTHKVYVNLGNKIDPADAQQLPRLLTWPVSGNAIYYTLIFLDLDVPVRDHPHCKTRQHWVITNIPGNNWRDGETLTAYLGPIAPRNTGFHRYIFFVYKQPKRLHFDEKRLTNVGRESPFRSCYFIDKFVDKYSLGHPYASNFFLSGWPLNQDEFPPRRKNITATNA